MRGRTAFAVAWVSIVMMGNCSCATRESAKQPPGAAADSLSKSAAASADSMLAMTTSIPEWLDDSSVPEPTLGHDRIVALAPAEIRLQDMGFNPPAALPDTTGLKNKAKVIREWMEALTDYKAGNYESAHHHLQAARELVPLVKDPDPLWLFRFRNLDAGAIYSTSPPGEVRRVFGEIAEPDRENIFDVAYQWVMAMDDLRSGNGRHAAARLQFIGRSPHPLSMEARRMLSILLPNAGRDSSDA